MPRDRRPNLDKKISGLIADLKAALVQREQQTLEAQVSARVDALVNGLTKVGGGGSKAVAVPSKPASAAPRKRKGWSAAAKAAARERMRKFWAAKKGKAAKRGRRAKAAPAKGKKHSPGRLRQIAAMRKYHAQKKAGKAASPAAEAAK